MGCSPVNSETGSGRLRTTCHTPAWSRSHSVSALRSASSKNNEATELLILGTAAAPTSRELLPAPLICSLTLNVQPPRLVELWREDSAVSTTARKKFFC